VFNVKWLLNKDNLKDYFLGKSQKFYQISTSQIIFAKKMFVCMCVCEKEDIILFTDLGPPGGGGGLLILTVEGGCCEDAKK